MAAPVLVLQITPCFGSGTEYIKQFTAKDKDGRIENIEELSRQGKSERQIAMELGVSVAAVTSI